MQVVRRVDTRGEVMILGILGDLDLGSVPALRSASTEIAADGWARVVVDLSGVTFIDSAGMGALIGLRRRCVAADGDCVLASASTDVSRQLATAELDRLFLVFDDVEQAVVKSAAA